MMNAVHCATQGRDRNVLVQEISVLCLVAYVGGAIKDSMFHISHLILLLINW